MTLSFARTFLQDYYRSLNSAGEFDGTPEEVAQAMRVLSAGKHPDDATLLQDILEL